VAKVSRGGQTRGQRVGRRGLIKGGGALALSALASCANESRAIDEPPQLEFEARNAPLVPDPDGLLELPPGFTYRVLQEPLSTMSDGYRAPGRPDAMCCFLGRHDRLILMRNHELWQLHEERSPFFPDQPRPPEAYDPLATGAVTRMVLEPDTLKVRSSNLVLAGTLWNCAGGPSPWGFLSCEETVEDDHGYVFLCATDAESVQPAQRIDGYGRMRHEAAAVDPRTHIAYLTEDRPDAGFYRFFPRRKDEPFEGVLQALRVLDAPGFDTGLLRAGERVSIDWVDVPQPTPDDDSVRLQAQLEGAAIFRRSEGLWLTDDAAFITATAGGPIARGQVFRLGLRGAAVLEVIAESTNPDVLDMPDNLCTSPAGLLYVAEDGDSGNSVRRIWPDGSITTFAHNARNLNEFAGPCFSPDGQTLFLSLQEDGLTFAIRGPFDRDETIVHNQASALLRSNARGRALGIGALALAVLLRGAV
jgi:secreted PhoX family phosphatase